VTALALTADIKKVVYLFTLWLVALCIQGMLGTEEVPRVCSREAVYLYIHKHNNNNKLYKT
jgi:hypothetical protein